MQGVAHVTGTRTWISDISSILGDGALAGFAVRMIERISGVELSFRRDVRISHDGLWRID